MNEELEGSLITVGVMTTAVFRVTRYVAIIWALCVDTASGIDMIDALVALVMSFAG